MFFYLECYKLLSGWYTEDNLQVGAAEILHHIIPLQYMNQAISYFCLHTRFLVFPLAKDF